MKLILQNLIFIVLFIIHALNGASTQNTFKFKDVSTLKIERLFADIQFVISPQKDVSITTDSQKFEELTFSSEDRVLSITPRKDNLSPQKLRISIPDTLLLEINTRNKSHVFIPEIKSPLKIFANDASEITVASCLGLLATLNGKAKVQIRQFNGDMVLSQFNKSEFTVSSGQIGTALISATEQSRTSIAVPIQSLKLETKGSADVKLYSVMKALTWTGRGNERISINILTGVAEITANYNSSLSVDNANLDTLFASTGATGKIKILGIVKNAALSARGAGEIVVDKITEKILRKSELHKGKIKVLTP